MKRRIFSVCLFYCFRLPIYESIAAIFWQSASYVFFLISFFQFFYDLITNKARKLEFAESNLIMENIPSSLPPPSLSLCWLGCLSFSFTFFNSHTLSLSLFSWLFVDAALILLWRDVIYYPQLTPHQLS